MKRPHYRENYSHTMESQAQTPKLLDQVRSIMRLHHYSIHTERSYLDWIKRYVLFHRMQSREDLADAGRKIEAFLTDLRDDVSSLYLRFLLATSPFAVQPPGS